MSLFLDSIKASFCLIYSLKFLPLISSRLIILSFSVLAVSIFPLSSLTDCSKNWISFNLFLMVELSLVFSVLRLSMVFYFAATSYFRVAIDLSFSLIYYYFELFTSLSSLIWDSFSLHSLSFLALSFSISPNKLFNFFVSSFLVEIEMS